MTEPDFDFCARQRRLEEFQLRRARVRWWLSMAAVAAATVLVWWLNRH